MEQVLVKPSEAKPAGHRQDIAVLEAALLKVPGAVRGDSEALPLKHSFAEGMYVREIFIPKGTVLTGKIHRHSHPNFLMRGEVIVVTEQGGREHLKAPVAMVSAPGTKRAILALEDTVWITVHATHETDLAKIEDCVIAKSYDDLLPSGEKPMIESELETKNCLILALKEKGREFRPLLKLKAEGILLPFNESMVALREAGVSLDGLFALKQDDGVWHVTTSAGGIALTYLWVPDSAMVGTWVAVAVGGSAVVGAGTSIYLDSKKKSPSYQTDPNLNALQQEQLKLLQDQEDQQKMFAPLLSRQAGYQPIYGPDPKQAEIFKRLDELYKGKPEGWMNDETNDLNRQLKDLGYSGGGGPSQVVVGYERTEAAGAQDAALAKLQQSQMDTAQKANDALNKYLDTLNSDDYKAYQKAQQDLQAQQTQIALKQGERTQMALEGKLPLSQGTIDRKAQDFQLLKENLSRGGNALIGDDPSSAYSLSSAGSQALKEFNSRYASIEDQERRGALDSGTSAYLQAVGLSGNLGKADTGVMGQLSNPGGYATTSTSINPMSPITNNASLIQGYSSAINPYLQQQQLSMQGDQFSSQMNSANQAGWLNLAGNVGGAAFGGYLSRRSPGTTAAGSYPGMG